MSKPLHIVIFDGSLATTTFISRLAHGLASDHTVSFIGFGGKPKTRSSGIAYYDIGTSEKPITLFLLSLQYAFQLVFKKGNIGMLFKTLARIVTNQKDALKQQNLNSVLAMLQPDMFHVQWPSLLPWCEAVIENNAIKVVLSQRGYQHNVRPFVANENMTYLKNVYPKIDGFHSVSNAMTQVGDAIYNAPHKIDRVVYSGFDFTLLPFQKTYKKNSTLQMLSVGRPHWVKGYPYALQACKLLKEHGVPFKYTIIGASQNEELRYLVSAYGLDEYVVLTQRIPQKDVYEQMQSSDVLLLPSLKEGLPNVVVESMALGLPVIATDCGGVSELLNDFTGWTIPTRDPEALAAAVQEFTKTTDAHIMEQRINARQKVEQQHGIAAMLAGMEGLYREVVGE